MAGAPAPAGADAEVEGPFVSAAPVLPADETAGTEAGPARREAGEAATAVVNAAAAAATANAAALGARTCRLTWSARPPARAFSGTGPRQRQPERLSGMSLRRAWEENAESWIAWARAPGHDSYWQFHGRRFSELLPEPGRLTLDVGTGEGRLARDLVSRGHRVLGVDASATLARAAATADPPHPVIQADAAALPLARACADLAVAFMVLQDVDDLREAVAELARVLVPGGALCMAIVHPLNSAGRFEGEGRDAPFVIESGYTESFRYHDDVERDGLTMDFHSEHRPLQAYADALEASGFVVERIREVTVDDRGDRWSRIPLFLDLRARAR